MGLSPARPAHPCGVEVRVNGLSVMKLNPSELVRSTKESAPVPLSLWIPFVEQLLPLLLLAGVQFKPVTLCATRNEELDTVGAKASTAVAVKLNWSARSVPIEIVRSPKDAALNCFVTVPLSVPAVCAFPTVTLQLSQP